MTNDEKVRLIKKIIGDFWEFHDQEETQAAALVMVTVINSVVEFKEADADE